VVLMINGLIVGYQWRTPCNPRKQSDAANGPSCLVREPASQGVRRQKFYRSSVEVMDNAYKLRA
jgi:hypothetical protein